jgi:creatinine amidohydrolase/Fe(II)-dependent formamide hydrolase-like protein
MFPLPDATNSAATHAAFFFSNPGSVYRATHSGTWGDARAASPETGERFLGMVSRATIRMLEDIDKTFAAMPPR